MDGWKTILSIWEGLFSGAELLVLGNVGILFHLFIVKWSQVVNHRNKKNRPNRVSVEILTDPGFKVHEENIEQIQGCLGKCYLVSLSVNQKINGGLKNANKYMMIYIYKVPLIMSVHQALLGLLRVFTFKTRPDAVFWSLHVCSLVGFSGIIVLVQEVLCQSLTAWQHCV